MYAGPDGLCGMAAHDDSRDGMVGVGWVSERTVKEGLARNEVARECMPQALIDGSASKEELSSIATHSAADRVAHSSRRSARGARRHGCVGRDYSRPTTLTSIYLRTR